MKSVHELTYLLVLILSFSISCSKTVEDIVPQKDYFLNQTFIDVDCAGVESSDMVIFDYKDENIDVDLVLYDEVTPGVQYPLMCHTDTEPIEPGEAFLLIRYGGRAYHSFEGTIIFGDSILIDAVCYEIADRTYKKYNIRVNLLCKNT